MRQRRWRPPPIVRSLTRRRRTLLGWNGLPGNVTTVGSAGSTSFYGAFDMNGNLWEWNETLIGLAAPGTRGLRGGSYGTSAGDMPTRFDQPPLDEIIGNYGFRLASPVPEPGSVALLALGAPLLARRRS